MEREELKRRLEGKLDEYQLKSDEPLRYEYVDGYEKETVIVTSEVNRYGVTKYLMTIEYFKRDNEIPNPSACHECNESCIFYNEEFQECIITEDNIDNWIKQHENKKHLKVDNGVTKIDIHNKAIDEVCCVNITHTHLYRGVVIDIETYSLEQLEAILELRDILRNLYIRGKF